MASTPELYEGESEGFKLLTEGYLGYAQEVILRRSIPDLRDGLKPVQRRILYTMHKHKNNKPTKSNTIVGNVMAIHPHGDSAIYDAMVRLTDRNGSTLVPLVSGKGNHGRVWSTDPAAASRYTEAWLGDTAQDFFQEFNGIQMQEAEVEGYVEPEVLAARYPYILVSGSLGLAVSVSTAIPSFNFWDVLEATEEVITKGGLGSKTLVPDFPTGGHYIYDPKQLAKIMHTGKGTLKIRADIIVEGKKITVTQLPQGQKIENLERRIKESEIPGIRTVTDASDFKNPGRLIISCSNAKVVESVLLELYRLRILQTQFDANIVTINGGKPVIGGVDRIIKEWTAWRRSVIITEYRKKLSGIQEEKLTLGYFLRLVQNREWRDHYIDLMVNKSVSQANTYLKSLFSDIPDPVVKWISERRLAQFNKGGEYEERLNTLESLTKEYQGNIDDPNSFILRDLDDLRRKYRGRFERKTSVSYVDYQFRRVEETAEEDTRMVTFSVNSEGFIKKSIGSSSNEGIFNFTMPANGILVGFDALGRVLRVFGEDIPYTEPGKPGVYLPGYWGVEEHNLLYLSRLDGTTKMLVYTDGNVSFLDTSEWLGKRNKTKVIQKGVHPSVGSSLLEVFEESEMNDYLLVVNEDTKDLRLGVARVDGIIRKSRTGRTKVFTGPKVELGYLGLIGNLNINTLVTNVNGFFGKVRSLNGERFLGDPNEHLTAGRYNTSKF